MKLTVYKGFSIDFLNTLEYAPLVREPIQKKKNVLQYDKTLRKQLDIAILSMNESDLAILSAFF